MLPKQIYLEKNIQNKTTKHMWKCSHTFYPKRWCILHFLVVWSRDDATLLDTWVFKSEETQREAIQGTFWTLKKHEGGEISSPPNIYLLGGQLPSVPWRWSVGLLSQKKKKKKKNVRGKGFGGCVVKYFKGFLEYNQQRGIMRLHQRITSTEHKNTNFSPPM